MIKLSNISKTFKVSKRGTGIFGIFKRKHHSIHALSDVSFNIKPGEIVGYIGPNGAGKSTTIKIMSGILRPSSGFCVINGKVPYLERRSYVKDIGVVFGQRSGLWWDTPVIDSFNLLKEIYKISDLDFESRLNDLVSWLDIKDIINTPVRQLSLGQRMRCEIAAALLHNPKILFLDEPTIGLDAVSKLKVRHFIKELNKKFNTTIVLTTHDMQDIESLCHRIILIGKGKLLYDGDINHLKKKFRKKYIMLEYSGKLFEMIAGLTLVSDEENLCTIEVDPKVIKLNEAINYISSNVEIIEFEIKETSIEEIVVKLYEEYKL